MKIESGIPIPSKNRHLEGELALTMRKMKVGDSVLFKENKSPYRLAKKLGVSVTTRKMNGEGFRVWRVK